MGKHHRSPGCGCVPVPEGRNPAPLQGSGLPAFLGRPAAVTERPRAAELLLPTRHAGPRVLQVGFVGVLLPFFFFLNQEKEANCP